MADHNPSPGLVASYWTLAGAYPGRGADLSRFSLRERAVAARKAGFCGLGLLAADLEHTLQTSSLKDCKNLLDDEGMTHVELEFLVGWFEEGPARLRADERTRFLLDAAEVLEPAFIKVGDFDRSVCPLSRLIDSFGILCDQARQSGTRIAFEPMPGAVIDNLADALALVRGAAAANGGLAIDIWHMTSLKEPFQELAKIPAEFLLCVELNDAPIPAGSDRPSPDRVFCGEGDLDLRGFIEAIRATGFSGPWGVELFSDRLAALDLDEAAQRAAETTRTALRR